MKLPLHHQIVHRAVWQINFFSLKASVFTIILSFGSWKFDRAYQILKLIVHCLGDKVIIFEFKTLALQQDMQSLVELNNDCMSCWRARVLNSKIITLSPRQCTMSFKIWYARSNFQEPNDNIIVKTEAFKEKINLSNCTVDNLMMQG